MTTCSSLSKLECRTCGETTLHNKNACIHCDTVYRFDRIYDRPEKALEFTIARARGTAKKAGGRRRGGKQLTGGIE